MAFPYLFSPGSIGACHLKNRIIMPLYPTKYATESKVNSKMLAFYRSRAKGGVALIVLDCPCLDYPRAYKGPQELRFDLEDYASSISELLHVIHEEGAKAFTHLNYPKERVFKEQVLGAKKKGDVWIAPLANTMSAQEADEIVQVMANGGNKKTKFRTIPPHESPPGSLVDLAAQVKASIDIPVVAIGKINRPEMADEIISQGKADFVAMARALVADPDLPNKAASGMIDDIRGCVYCLEDCVEKGAAGMGRCCTVNPFAGMEHTWKVSPAQEKKKVLVIGGGPSGIQASLIASERGHDVELWERNNQLGGQAKLMNIAPFKGEMSEVLRYLNHCLDKSQVKLRLGQEAEKPQIRALKPETVVVATGSRAVRPAVPGIDSEMVVDARELYEKKSTVGRKIVNIGGGDIGCETADWLASPEKEITVVEILPEVLPKMKTIPKERLLSRLSEKNVTIFVQSQVISIEENEVLLKKGDAEELKLEADQVIIATPTEPENRLFSLLKDTIKEVVLVGDAASPGNLGDALRGATEAALKI